MGSGDSSLTFLIIGYFESSHRQYEELETNTLDSESIDSKIQHWCDATVDVLFLMRLYVNVGCR